MLGRLAAEVSVGIGKDKDAMVAFDDARLSARVAGQPCVTGWVDVASANALADPELRGLRHVPAGRRPPGHERGNRINSQGGTCLGRAVRRLAAVDRLASHKTAADQQFCHPSQEFLVVAHSQVFRGRDQFSGG